MHSLINVVATTFAGDTAYKYEHECTDDDYWVFEILSLNYNEKTSMCCVILYLSLYFNFRIY